MAIIPGVYQAKNAISDDSQQGSKFNSIVNAIVNPANTSLLTGFDPVIEEVSSPNAGTVVTYMPQTVSGTPPLSLPNSLGKPLKAWEVALSPYQDLHGYDAPWPAGGGRNKLPDTPRTAVARECTFTFENGHVTLTGTAVGSGGRLELSTLPFSLKAGTYYLNLYDVSGAIEGVFVHDNTTLIAQGSTSDRTIPFVLESDSDMINIGVNVVDGRTYNYSALWGVFPSIESYTPYSNLCPILGTDKLNVFVEESYDQSATPKAVPTLPQTVYTGTIGSEGGESRDDAVDMGSLSWSVWVNDTHTFVTRVPQSDSTKQQLTCESYKPLINGSAQWGAILSYDMVVYKPLGDVYLMCRNTNYSDAESFKQSVQGVKLVYPIATPTTFAVPSPTIPTPTGTATTWATAENGTVDSMEVTYVGKA